MTDRSWLYAAVARIEADVIRSADTHLIPLQLPAFAGITLYLKDESTHPSGSLKHRLARSLFLYGLCNGWIGPATTVIEASSGSTAVSEAYFARLLGLKFVAVMPASTSPEKIALIEFQGGECHLIADPTRVQEESRRLAATTGGHFMDQFTYAERATDWRGNNNIAESIFQQLAREPYPIPEWIVVGAGTGGTSATLGRFVRYRQHASRVCVVDPDNSVFFDAYRDSDSTLCGARGSAIEGIGRSRVEPSFMPDVVNRMIKVPDEASLAAIHVLECLMGRRAGASTGTNLAGCLQLMAEMRAAGKEGSVVTLLCDGGERYRHSYYDEGWIAEHRYDVVTATARLEALIATGTDPSPLPSCDRD